MMFRAIVLFRETETRNHHSSTVKRFLYLEVFIDQTELDSQSTVLCLRQSQRREMITPCRFVKWCSRNARIHSRGVAECIDRRFRFAFLSRGDLGLTICAWNRRLSRQRRHHVFASLCCLSPSLLWKTFQVAVSNKFRCYQRVVLVIVDTTMSFFAPR